APPSPDYIHGPEEPEQAPPSPDYILGPEHADDEIVAEDQPYAEDALPIAQSPEYVQESDFEAHLEDDDDEDPEEDPVDYPADRGDDGDDEEEMMRWIEADEEEEEEHPAPADSVVVAPTAANQAPSAEETEPFETDESATTPPPHPAYRMTAKISIPAPVPMPEWTDSEVVRLLAISSLPASPLSPWSSPPPQIPFPPLPLILSPPSGIGVHTHIHMSKIRELQAADRRRQTVISELLRIDHKRSIEISELRTALQGQVTALQGQVIALQAQVTTLQGLARSPTRSGLPEEAGDRVTTALAARDALRSTNGDDCHNSGTGELALLCGRMFFEEADKIEKYVGGLPNMIHGSVVASKPKTMQEAIEIATELMDKKIRTFAERKTASKRKFENTSRNTQNQQQHLNKRDKGTWGKSGNVTVRVRVQGKRWGRRVYSGGV
nr:hypothetical protein [Tanacetum cinerariifolium]